MTAPDATDTAGDRLCRLTIDLDSYIKNFQLTAIRAYHNVQAAGAVDVEVRVSSSGHGIHLIAWFDELLHPATKQRLRETLGDDPNRIRMDAERGAVNHTTNVLWTQKGDADVETGFDDIYHALETIEQRQRPPTAGIAHSFANNGRKAVGRLAHPTKTPQPHR